MTDHQNIHEPSRAKSITIAHQGTLKELKYLVSSPTPSPTEENALLLLHGILGDARTWKPYLSAFPQHEVFALTQSGFGTTDHSDRSDRLFDTTSHAQELVAFCQALNLQDQKPQRKFTIIAWSYGCHPALLAAKIAPELFKSLILYELIIPSYGMKEEEQALFTSDLTKMMSPIIKAYRRQKEATAIDTFIAACKNREYALGAQSPELQKIKTDNAHTLQKLLTQTEPAPLSADELRALHHKVPITIYYGENSRAIFQLSSQAAMRAIGQTEGMIVDADHLLPEEDPQKLIPILHAHLLK